MPIFNQPILKKLKFSMHPYSIAIQIHRNKTEQENLSIDLNSLDLNAFDSSTVVARYHKDPVNKIPLRDVNMEYVNDLYHFSFNPRRQDNVLTLLYFDKERLIFDQTLDTQVKGY